MSHEFHELPRRIFGDDCEECVERASTIAGLGALDSTNIRKLASLAVETKAGNYSGDLGDSPSGSSRADMKAVDNLRLAARIVFRSGITEEVAR